MKLKKTRSDAWGETLADEEKWQLYHFSKPLGDQEPPRPELLTYEAARDFATARGYPELSRAGWFRFLARMRQKDNLRLVFKVGSSGDTAHDLASESERIPDEVAIKAFSALAVDAAVSGDKEGMKLFKTAECLTRDAIRRDQELELRKKSEVRKDDELRLAREKFEAAEKRLNAVQNAVAVAKTQGGLTEETLKKIEEAAGLL